MFEAKIAVPLEFLNLVLHFLGSLVDVQILCELCAQLLDFLFGFIFFDLKKIFKLICKI